MASSTHEFKTETKRLLELMIHSLYSNRDIFVRELVSNASDALDKLRFEALTDSSLISEDAELGIRIELDAEKRLLTFHDNGIGMSKDEVIANIGTIAKSGSKEFVELMGKAEDAKKRPDLIGQFGVGFYSSFLVADKVTLITRRAGEDSATKWESDGTGSYDIDTASRDTAGSSITLHLQKTDEEDGVRDYTSEWVIRDIVKRYSDFVSYPIRLEVVGAEKKSDDPINSMKAIWTRPASKVTDDEYNEFYKHISHDWNDPIARVATKIEGTLEARGLLFIPSKAPFDLFHQNMDRRGLQLYVKRVFIMDEAKELLPPYLRFVKGVIDAEDLPLNVSREILQENRVLAAIKKHVIKKVLDHLGKMKKAEGDDYATVWGEFGAVLKEGLLSGVDSQKRILDLVLAHSTTDGDELTSISDYIERQEEDHSSIYYITAPSIEAARRSPHLEAFREGGIEVLVFTDRVDEMWLSSIGEYKDKKFQSVGHGEVDLGDSKADKDDKNDTSDSDKTETESELNDLMSALRVALQEEVTEVRSSKRLTTSAACLVTPEGTMSLQMEQLMRASGQKMPEIKRILEINPKHPVTDRLIKMLEADKDSPAVGDYAQLLYGQALLAEGGQLTDPVAFARRVSDLMAR